MPIRDWDLYRQALTAASAIGAQLRSLERFEFLGDAVLDAAVRQILHARFPDASVEPLGLMRDKYISGIFMYRLAALLQLDKFVATNVLVRTWRLRACTLPNRDAFLSPLYDRCCELGT